MKIEHGLISADSHVTFDRDDFTSRMSEQTWGDRIPQVVEVEIDGQPGASLVCLRQAWRGTTSPTARR